MSQTKNKIATAAYGFTANGYLTRTGKRDFATATAVTMLGTPDGSPYRWPGFRSSRAIRMLFRVDDNSPRVMSFTCTVASVTPSFFLTNVAVPSGNSWPQSQNTN
jgi:hypothetical protein